MITQLTRGGAGMSSEGAFRGTLEECLSHHREQMGDNYDSRRIAAEFTGANYRNTVLFWFLDHRRTGYPPLGEYAIKIRVFLDLLGYRVKENESLDPVVYTFMKCAVFGLTGGLQEAARNVGVGGGKSYLLRIFRGNIGAAPKVKERMQKWNEELKEQREQKEVEWKRRLAPYALKTSATSSPLEERIASAEQSASDISEPQAKKASEAGVTPRDEAIEILARLVQSALPLAEYLASDECSAEDREKLRRAAGRHGVFNLKNTLVQLCGERVRQEARKRNA